MKARDVMNTSLLHLERGTSVAQAAHAMAGQHVGSLIVTAGGYPIGIVTETDLVRLVAHGKNPANTGIEEIMSSPLFSTTPDTDMIHIANTMTANKIKKMPVIEHGRVVGIITQTDVIKHVLHVCSAYNEQMRSGTNKEDPNLAKFITCSVDMFSKVNAGHDNTKHWHMRCLSCGHRFMTEEKAGRLEHTVCPQCGGRIDYDPAPPL